MDGRGQCETMGGEWQTVGDGGGWQEIALVMSHDLVFTCSGV